MAQAPTRLKRAGAWLLGLALAGLLAAGGLGRLVRVEAPAGAELVWLWAWQGGRVEFVNSVSGRPVSISFGLPWRFANFAAATDPGTEEYYTAGAYAWNQRLAGQESRQLDYCSEVGLILTLGSRVFHQQNGGCLRLRLVWPP